MPKIHRSTSIAALFAVLLCGAGCQTVESKAKTDANAGRKAVALTIYRDFASVHEGRPVKLAAGANAIDVSQVSKLLDQSSVTFDWPERTDASVVASTYDLGTEASGALLKRYLGKEVELVQYDQNGHESQRTKAKLEVAGDGTTVLLANGKYLVNPPGSIEAPADGGGATIPNLNVQIDSKNAAEAQLGVSYLTQGLSWQADYVANLQPTGDAMALQCWAAVTNTTGVDYPEAALTFVSGSPNRAAVVSAPADMSGMREEYALAKREAPLSDSQGRPRMQPQWQKTGELHAYQAPKPATLRPDQISRVKISEDTAQVSKDYAIRINGMGDYYPLDRPANRRNAVLTLNFKNAKASGLGTPLPAGAVRVYEPGPNGVAQYIGAATMNDTPVDAGANLTISQVFDVWTEGTLTSTKRIDRNTIERVYRLTAHNAKAQPITLRVAQDVWEGAKVVHESIPSAKTGGLWQWMVPIPAGGSTSLQFTTRSRW